MAIFQTKQSTKVPLGEYFKMPEENRPYLIYGDGLMAGLSGSRIIIDNEGEEWVEFQIYPTASLKEVYQTQKDYHEGFPFIIKRYKKDYCHQINPDTTKQRWLCTRNYRGEDTKMIELIRRELIETSIRLRNENRSLRAALSSMIYKYEQLNNDIEVEVTKRMEIAEKMVGNILNPTAKAQAEKSPLHISQD